MRATWSLYRKVRIAGDAHRGQIPLLPVAPGGKDAPAVARVYTRAAQAGNVPGPTPTRDPNLGGPLGLGPLGGTNLDRDRSR